MAIISIVECLIASHGLFSKVNSVMASKLLLHFRNAHETAVPKQVPQSSTPLMRSVSIPPTYLTFSKNCVGIGTHLSLT